MAGCVDVGRAVTESTSSAVGVICVEHAAARDITISNAMRSLLESELECIYIPFKEWQRVRILYSTYVIS